MRWVTRVEPVGPSTRITQSLEYKIKFGPVGWLLDNLVMKRKLTATLDEVFASLVKHDWLKLSHEAFAFAGG